MEYYTNLTITDNTNNSEVFKCTTKPNMTDDAENYLTALDGWDTYTGTSVNTVPKLIGSGAYVESIHHNEREITVTVSLYDENEAELVAKKDLLGHVQHNEVSVTVRADLYQVSADRVTETLMRTEWFDDCLISGIPTWDRINSEALLAISVTALNPDKNYTEYIAGVGYTGVTF